MGTVRRLIDANALLRRICNERDEIEPKTACDIGYHNGLNMAASMAISAPTVDAVEVVRCKNCIHRHTRASCQGRRPDWYCPNGERKTNEP